MRSSTCALTGANGFVSSNLLQALRLAGHDVLPWDDEGLAKHEALAGSGHANLGGSG